MNPQTRKRFWNMRANFEPILFHLLLLAHMVCFKPKVTTPKFVRKGKGSTFAYSKTARIDILNRTGVPSHEKIA